MNNERITEDQELFKKIPFGSRNKMYVPNNHSYFRYLVADANKSGDCIINIRGGYFRPIPGVDDKEVEHYFARELHRAREILFKRKRMKQAFINLKV